jgi:hypothetical protein
LDGENFWPLLEFIEGRAEELEGRGWNLAKLGIMYSLFVQRNNYLSLGVYGRLRPRNNEIHPFRRVEDPDGIDEVRIFSYWQAAVHLNNI